MNDRPGARWIGAISEINAEEWNGLANQYDSPLLDWEWLSILERSGSVSEREGWIPQHLLYYENGTLIAAAPLYIKTHSVGEFVFDYAWAEVAQQLGASYYPKLVAMSPLTPAIGYRFLIDRQSDYQRVLRAMIDEIDRFVTENELKSFSILWPEADFEEEVRRSTDLSFTPWQHQHFRWENEGFQTFDDYLAVFKKNQRRNIKRERRSMSDQGLRLETMFAADAPASFARTMYRYYTNTNDQFGMWAARYLTPRFFDMIKDGPGHRVVYSAAFEEDSQTPIGMSMLLYKPDRLIGRYWGAERFVDNLHFNLCYYEPIRWGIEHGVKRFDPGMGSSHKVRRGFQAVAVDSLHHFTDQRMQMVMEMNIERINSYEQAHIDELNRRVPFASHTRGNE
jgi:hypothetical protein